MGTYKFIQDYVSPNAKDLQAKQKDTKYRPTDPQTLQAIVDILFDGNVDEHSNITINGLRKDFSGKCHFKVVNECVLINYVDIFHAVYKPVRTENTRKAMSKFIEQFKQLKDKYTIKVVSRSDDSSKYGIGIEPTLIITGFTEEELDILRGNSKVVKPDSPLFISLEELTKKIIHFANEFKDESNPLFEKVEVFNKLLKSGKVNFGTVYNGVSDYLTFNRSTVKRLGNDGKCYLLSNTYRENASVYFVKDELILGKIYTDKDVVKLDDNKQYVVIPESLIANTLLNISGDNSNVVSGYNYSTLNAVFDKEALLDHYHDIVSEITKHDLILNRGASLELERIYLSDVSSDVRTNGGWGKLYKEVSGKELNESGFGTVKICDGLYGIKDGLFNIYSQSNKEYSINEF